MFDKKTQAGQNPFPFSDSNKRYHTYDYYLRHAFGGKVAKLTLDGGFTCPNIDGRCGTGGCIYCAGDGSGHFTVPSLSIREQYLTAREIMCGKWDVKQFIPYFQAHTNTYAPLPRLRELFEEALAMPGAVGLNIATRADCIENDVLGYLKELSERTVLTLELGLQTVHDQTARRINRGHTFKDFLSTYWRIKEQAPNVRIGVHLILGLPGEDEEMMLESVERTAGLLPDEIKLHLLYVMEGTVLAEQYLGGQYLPLDREKYILLAVRALERIAPETVIGRLTGDAPRRALLAPLWSTKKLTVLNDIDKMLYLENTWQGKFFKA